jgi:hypothetical protein
VWSVDPGSTTRYSTFGQSCESTLSIASARYWAWL